MLRMFQQYQMVKSLGIILVSRLRGFLASVELHMQIFQITIIF